MPSWKVSYFGGGWGLFGWVFFLIKREKRNVGKSQWTTAYLLPENLLMNKSYILWTCDPFPCKFSRIENTVFIQFPNLIDQLQQGPVVVSWTNPQEDAQEALKGKRILLYSFYPSCLFGGRLLSCIHISGTWQDLLQSEWTAQCQFTAHSHLCSKPLHEPFSRSISRREELSMGKVSIITTFCFSSLLLPDSFWNA